MTLSLGSICLGSLIVAFIPAARAVVSNMRQQDDGGGLLACCAECLLGCIESIALYFNKWAYVVKEDAIIYLFICFERDFH